MLVNCPYCESPKQISPEMVGERLECLECQRNFLVKPGGNQVLRNTQLEMIMNPSILNNEEVDDSIRHTGIQRRVFAGLFLGSLLFYFIPFIGFLIFLFCVIKVLKLRLDNVGMDSNWAFAILVPGFNIWVMACAFGLPEGYREGEKMDAWGYVICGTVFVLMVSLSVLWIMNPESFDFKNLFLRGPY